MVGRPGGCVDPIRERDKTTKRTSERLVLQSRADSHEDSANSGINLGVLSARKGSGKTARRTRGSIERESREEGPG